MQYVGRFAPTPSGPLHFGSIIAAVASFFEARTSKGKWLLRFDDIDSPRVVSSAYGRICHTLEVLNLTWDDAPLYQKDNLDVYQEIIDQLSGSDRIYRCYCPRKLVKGIPYPGTCRSALQNKSKRHALRVKVQDISVSFSDQLQGDIQQNLNSESGDFVVFRSDKIFAYNLAAAVDDTSDITHVIRGADLLDTTPKQIYLQSLLGLKTPVYGHAPVAVNADGKKLSKQHGADDVLLTHTPSQVLVNTLEFLGQPVENGLSTASVNTVIQWAMENWALDQVSKVKTKMV